MKNIQNIDRDLSPQSLANHKNKLDLMLIKLQSKLDPMMLREDSPFVGDAIGLSHEDSNFIANAIVQIKDSTVQATYLKKIAELLHSTLELTEKGLSPFQRHLIEIIDKAASSKVILSDNILEVLGTALDGKRLYLSENIAKAFENIANNQELPKNLKIKMTQLLLEYPTSNQSSQYLKILSNSKTQLSEEMVVHLRKTIDTISSSEFKQGARFLDTYSIQTRIGIYNLLAEKNCTSNKDASDVKHLSQRPNYSEADKKAYKELSDKITANLSKPPEKTTTNSKLQLSDAKTIIEELNKPGNNSVIQQNLIKSLENLITSGKLSEIGKFLSRDETISNQIILKSIYQFIKRKHGELPINVKQKLLDISVDNQLSVAMRLKTISLLQDIAPKLKIEDCEILAKNLSDSNLSVAQSSNDIFGTISEAGSVNPFTLSKILSKRHDSCNSEIKSEIESVMSTLAASETESLIFESDLESNYYIENEYSEITEIQDEEISDLEQNNYIDDENLERPAIERIKISESHINAKGILSQSELITELGELNPNQINSAKLAEKIELVKESYELDSKILPQNIAISKWNETEVKNYTTHLLKNNNIANNRQYLPEIIALTIRANKLHTGHELRDVQILSLLTLLESVERGKLLQISTGEGKSTNVAILAAIKALQGETVDVVTSSQVLAKRDASEWSGFFNMLNLTVGHNIDPEYKSGVKECYTQNIVYGDVGSFQGDWLKTIYRDLDTRGARQFGAIIVDEVDSMLIDESSKIVKLSNSLRGSEYFAPIFVTCFHELENLCKHLVYDKEKKQHLFIQSDFEYIDGKLTLFSDNKSALENILYIENVEEFKTQHLENYLSILIHKKLLLPNHLKVSAQQSITNWAKSAVRAQAMTIKRDYLITRDNSGNDIIAPVDYINTGLVQGNTVWENGLQQFLQVKHNLRISQESNTTSFISNMNYFKKYNNKIFGLTGTLGSKESQQLLMDVYNVDLTIVPTYKAKQFEELPAIILNTKETWVRAIAKGAIEQTQQGRAVLIICETVLDVEEIEQHLKSFKGEFSKLIRYSRNDNDEHLAVGNKILAREVIIATNLAGRGTDIKLDSSVQKAGGLHVIVTFLPTNARVESQAFGRTSRQGQPGSGQLIIDENILYKKWNLESNIENGTIADYKALRDGFERIRLATTKEQEIAKLELEDDLFNQYCRFYKKLKQDKVENYILQQLEEDWGVALKCIQKEYRLSSLSIAEKKQQALNMFKEFENSSKNLKIKNPAYLTEHGINQFGKNNSYNDSISILTQASELDDIFGFAAHYNLAYAHLRNGHMEAARTNKGTTTYTAFHKEVARSLNIAKSQIDEAIIPQLQATQICTQSGSPLSKQTESKIELMQTLSRKITSDFRAIENVEDGEVLKVGAPPSLWHTLFEARNTPHSEIQELEAWGLYQLYDISSEDFSHADEKMLGGMVLSVAQVGFGALALTTGNPLLAAKLISGGIQDSYKTIKSEGHFKWNDYFVDKGIGIAVDLLTMGLEKMVSAAKTIGTATTSQLAKDAILSGAREATTAQIIRNSVVNAVTHIALNEAVQNVSKALVKQNETQIFGNIEAKLLHEFNTAQTGKKLNELLIFDSIIARSDSQDMLRRFAQEFVTEKRHILSQIGNGVVNGLTTSTNASLSVIATGLKFAKVGVSADKINSVQSDFVEAITAKIESIKLPPMDVILEAKLGLIKNNGSQILTKLATAKIWDANAKMFTQQEPAQEISSNVQGTQVKPLQLQELPKILTIDFGSPYLNDKKVNINATVASISKAQAQDYSAARARLASDLAGIINGTLRSRVTTQILMPVSSGAVNYIGQSIQNQLLRDIEAQQQLKLGVAAGDEAKPTKGFLTKLLSKEKGDKNQQELALVPKPETQLVAVKNTIKTGLIKSDEAITWVGEKLNGLESSFADKYPIVYFGYKGTNAYMSIQPDMVSKIMIDVGDYIAHKNDQYIVNPALNYIGIQQGQPGYTTGKIIIDSTIAGLIGKGLTKAITLSPFNAPTGLIKPSNVTVTLNNQVQALGNQATNKVLGYLPEVSGGFSESVGMRLKEACSELYHRPKIESHAIAGVGSEVKIKDIKRITQTYGGVEKNWAKFSSKQIEFNEGTLVPARNVKIELHWYENVNTGQKVEFKPVIDNKLFGFEKNK